MQNASLTFGFLTRNLSLGDLCVLHIQKRWEMLFRGIVKKYTADLILLTKLKKIVGMKENFLQNIEVALSLTEFLLQTQESFDGFFCLTFHILRWFLGEQDFRSSFLWFVADQIRNSNVLPRMCFQIAFSFKFEQVNVCQRAFSCVNIITQFNIIENGLRFSQKLSFLNI